MITLFTIPRAFTGGDKVRQENTLGSWTRLVPRPEIILFCDDPGVAEAAKQFGCIHVPDVRCNQDGIPYISHAFRLASQMATNNTLCYANADIIFVQDLIVATKAVKESFNDPFLIVGQRWNISIPGPLEFTEGWQHRLRSQIGSRSSKVSTSAIDYFVYPQGAVVSLPDFLVGSPKWDNWLVKDAEKRGVQVVSATEAITCIHQRHEHRWPAKGAEYNHGLWWRSGGGVGYVYSGSWVLDAGAQLRKKPGAVVDQAIKRIVYKPGFKHKPVPTPPTPKPRRTRPSRPSHARPQDELGLPVNVKVSASELAESAKKLRRQKGKSAAVHKKHSHAGPGREAELAERARLQEIQDTIRAARIEARDARIAERRKKRGK